VPQHGATHQALHQAAADNLEAVARERLRLRTTNAVVAINTRSYDSSPLGDYSGPIAERPQLAYGLKSRGAPNGTLSFFKDACSSRVLGPNTL
jgi:hypothetical protein